MASFSWIRKQKVFHKAACFISYLNQYHEFLWYVNGNGLPILKRNLDSMKICHTLFQYLKCCVSADNLIIKVLLPIAFHSYFYLEHFSELNVAILWCLFLLQRHK